MKDSVLDAKNVCWVIHMSDVLYHCECCGKPVKRNEALSRKYCASCCTYIENIKSKERQKMVSYKTRIEKKLRRLLEILPFDIKEEDIE